MPVDSSHALCSIGTGWVEGEGEGEGEGVFVLINIGPFTFTLRPNPHWVISPETEPSALILTPHFIEFSVHIYITDFI